MLTKLQLKQMREKLDNLKVVIIGAGVSGLSTGALLSNESTERFLKNHPE